MPSIQSPIAKVSLTGAILAVVATGSVGVYYSAGGFNSPGSTAATAAASADPTQSAQESPSESPSPEPTPEPTTPAQKMRVQRLCRLGGSAGELAIRERRTVHQV